MKKILDWCRAFEIRRPDGKTIFTSYSLDRKKFGIGFHVFEDADEEGCFHSHPAWAFRLVLWGGYVEEAWIRKDLGLNGYHYVLKKRRFFPGRFGFVAPHFEHRIDRLMFKRSVSLWIRGPLKWDILTRGC